MSELTGVPATQPYDLQDQEIPLLSVAPLTEETMRMQAGRTVPSPNPVNIRSYRERTEDHLTDVCRRALMDQFHATGAFIVEEEDVIRINTAPIYVRRLVRTLMENCEIP